MLCLQDISSNLGNDVVVLKKQVIQQACLLKEAERRITLLMDHHKKMAGLLKTAQANLSKKDEHIKQLEARLTQRDDKDVTLSQSVTKVVKAIFGERLSCWEIIILLYGVWFFIHCCFILQVQKTQ